MATDVKVSRIQGVVRVDPRRLRVLRGSLLAVTIVPLLGFAFAVWSLWGRGLSAADAGIALGLYAAAGLGVTVGFHRMLAHRTFDAPAAVRAILAGAGSLSIEMGAIDWAATHRRHHAYSDRPGDPHSPHLEDAQGLAGIAKGLWHAHMGWLFRGERTSRERWAPDLLKDPVIRKVDELFGAFVAASFLLPALLGLVVTRSLTGALTAFLWGGLARIFLLHHVTFSINSLCHFFGRRPYETREKSTNVWPLSLLSFGESWHNNHHAFPASPFLGLKPWQLDPGKWLIHVLDALGLIRNLRTNPIERTVASERAA